MDGFEIGTEQVVSAGMSVESTGHALAVEISAMERTLADLRVGWRSTEAAPRFAAVMDQHLGVARTLKDALLGHAHGLVSAARAFDEAELSLAQSIQGA